MSVAAVALAVPFAFGPLRLDMSIAELQAAAPAAGWEATQVSPFTQRVWRIRSQQPLEVAGAPFNVQAEVGYYHQRWVLIAPLPPKDAPACEQAMLGVLTALEPQLGPFSSRAPRTTPGRAGNLEWHSRQGPNGVVLMPSMGVGTAGTSSGEWVAFGAGSRVLVEPFDNEGRPRARKALLSRKPPNFDLSAFHRQEGQRLSVDGRFNATFCELQLTLERETAPPAPSVFDTSKARVVYEPTMAERHLDLPEAVAALPAAVEVDLSCRIDRAMGGVHGCDIQRTTPAAVELSPHLATYAHRLARERAYDTSGVDRDDPQAMEGTVRVRLDPADRRPIDFLEAPRTPLEQVVFVRQPEEEAPREQAGQPDRPVQPHQPGPSGQPLPVFTLVRQHFGTSQDRDIDVVVRTTCRIETDGSLVCGKAEWTEPADGPLDPGLRAVAYRAAATRYQAAPKLRDGTPSAGRVIELALRFRNH